MLSDPKLNTTDAAAKAPAELWFRERDICALIRKAARLSDDQKYVEWMDLFTDDGEYSAITEENRLYKGLRLFRDVGKTGLHERVAFLMGLLQTPRAKTVHLVTNIEIEDGANADEAVSTSNFLIVRTAILEDSKLYAAGRYLDRFKREDSVWRFKERMVVIHSNLLPAAFTELI